MKLPKISFLNLMIFFFVVFLINSVWPFLLLGAAMWYVFQIQFENHNLRHKNENSFNAGVQKYLNEKNKKDD